MLKIESYGLIFMLSGACNKLTTIRRILGKDVSRIVLDVVYSHLLDESCEYMKCRITDIEENFLSKAEKSVDKILIRVGISIHTNFSYSIYILLLSMIRDVYQNSMNDMNHTYTIKRKTKLMVILSSDSSRCTDITSHVGATIENMVPIMFITIITNKN